jgi:outer membrane receptor protein involved in Fe transport
MLATAAPALLGAGAWAQTVAASPDQQAAQPAAKTAATATTDGILTADAAPPPAADAGPATPPLAAPEEITVTGSLVKRSNLEAISPVVTVTSADIQAKGLTNSADVINQLPEAGVPGISNANSNFSTDAAGLEVVNLRNLGTSRTLVLIDGKRTAGGIPPGQGAGNGVDISTIPAYLIDKVDIVTGGGSSTYGSEAVAGVINFRLKESFNGILFNQQIGETSDYGDSRTTTTDLLMGSDFADGRGHALFAAEYQDEGIVKSESRPFAALDINNGGVYSPSSFTPYGSALTDSGRYVTLGDGSVAKYNADIYGFNREALRTIQIPTTKLDAYSKISYDILPELTYYADFKFARTTATSILEPIAIGAGQGSTTIGFNGDYLTIPLTNPYIPAALAAKGIVDDGAGGIGDFRRRFLELGDRGDQVTRYNFAITNGVRGTVLDRFDYDLYYSYSETTSTNVENNSGNVLNLQNSLNADISPVTGQIECSDPAARAQGCVPIDLFGPGKASAAALNYIRAIKTYNDDISEGDVNGKISGPVYSLPYGDVQLALGFEHRREDGSSTPDALTASGFGLDSSGPATRGGYAVTDLFTETKVPVLKDLPFAKQFTLDAAYRRSYYSLSNVGEQESYRYGGTYAPIKDIEFRIDNSVAIRAPNIDELFTGRTQNASSVVDPCSNNGLDNASNRAQRIANCLKIPGITPGFTEDQAAQQTEISYQSGNPNLNAERARVLTFGVVLQPRYIPRFSLSVDAFKYLIANAIQSIDLQTTANQCVDTGNPLFCQLVRRNPTTGIIQGVDSKVINVGAIREQGIDAQLNYELRVPALSKYVFSNIDDNAAVDFSWNYEYINYLNYITIPGNITEQTGDFGAPKNKWTLDTLYRDDKFQLNYDLRYLGQQSYDFYGSGPHFANRFYSDLSLRYQFTKKISAYVGVKNLFDRQPPQLDQNFQQTGAGVATGVTGTNTVPDVYDAIGRYIYLGVHAQF